MMPVIRKPASLGQRVFFTKAGLIKRIIFSEDPGDNFFNEPDSDEDEAIAKLIQDDSDDENSDDDGDDEKSIADGSDPSAASSSSSSSTSSPSKKNKKKEEKDDDEEEEIPDHCEADGYSIAVLSEGKFGKLSEATGYYPGQELIVTIRGVKAFQSFFVSAYLKTVQFDMFDEKSGGRVGSFDRASVMEQENAWLTCKEGDEMRAATSDSRKKNRSFASLRLKWTAPSEMGVGKLAFKATVVPKHLDDPELKNIYSLTYSLEEHMPPRKRGASGSSAFGSFSRSSSGMKPKIELSFDVSFNHNHMLTLFRDREHEIVEHYFAANVKCTLPLGKLGVQTVKGAKEVVDLLADFILGPNQIMKNVKPMPVTERVIESRTIVTRDLLPSSEIDLRVVKDAMRVEGHEDSDSASEEEYEEENENSTVTSANPNEPGDAVDGGALGISSSPSSLSHPSEKMSREEIATREEFMKIAMREVLMIRDMKTQEMACAEEVRTVRLPAHRAAVITEFAAESDDIVHGGKYGGSKLHLQMDLPPNYPHNARPYDLAAQAAKKGKDLMEAAQQKTANKKKNIGFKLNTSKGRRIFAKEIVDYMLKQKNKMEDTRARERRYGVALLPGFESLAQMREQALKARVVERVGNWTKAANVPLEKSRSSNPRATVNAGKRGDDAAVFIANLKVEREEANKKLLEAQREMESGGKGKPKLTWGTDAGDAPPKGERDSRGTRKGKRSMRNTFTKMIGFGGGSTKDVAAENDHAADSRRRRGGGGAGQSGFSDARKRWVHAGKMLKYVMAFKKNKAGPAGNIGNANHGEGALAAEEPSPKPTAELTPDELAERAADSVAGPVSSAALSTATSGEVRPVKLSKAPAGILKGGGSSSSSSSSSPPLDSHQSNGRSSKSDGKFDGKSDGKSYGDLPQRRVHLLTGEDAVVSKKHLAHIHERGGTAQRRDDFVELPGFDHGRHISKHKHLLNFDNDLLFAERQHGLVRTFLHESAREYDGHAASINEVCFSHDERRVASCSSDKTIKLWDPLDGNMVSTLYGHGDEVMGINFSHDSLFLVSCSLDNLVIVWNLTNGSILKKLFGHYDAVYRCCFTHNANAIMSASCDMTIKSWKLTPNVPDPPARPIMSEITTSKCLMTWQPPPGYNEAITAYFIEYRIGHRGDFGDTISVSGSDRRRKIYGLVPGTAYQFRIRATNRMGKGQWSEPSPQVITEFGIPQQMERPEVANVTTDKVTITWWAPVPSVRGSAIQNFHIQLSGYGVDFGKGATWKVSWSDCRDNLKKWEAEKEQRAKLDAEGRVYIPPTAKGRLKEAMKKIMMALRTKRNTVDKKRADRKSRASRASMGLSGLMASAFGEAKADVEGEKQKKKQIGGTEEEEEEREWVDVDEEGEEQEGTAKEEKKEKEGKKEKKTTKAGDEKKKSKKARKADAEKLGKEAEAVAATEAAEAEGRKNKITTTPKKKKRVKVDWVKKAAERKKQFIVQEIERTRRHLADNKARKLARDKKRAQKTAGRVKQKRRDAKKSDQSELVEQQLEEEEIKHKKLFAKMCFVATGLSPGIMYRVRVAAINNTGEGPFSQGCYSTFTMSECPVRAEAPYQLSKDLRSMMIEWSTPHDNGAAITGFMIRQCYGDRVEHEFRRTVQKIIIDELEPGFGYKFQMKCCNSEGWSEWSEESPPLMTLTKEPNAPEKPTILRKTQVSVTIKVKKPDENGDAILHYAVKKREMSVRRKTPWGAAGTFSVVPGLEIEEEIDDPLPPHKKILVKYAHITVESLNPASHYDFQVQVENNTGASPFSPSSFRTKTLPSTKPSRVENVRTGRVGPTNLVLRWDEVTRGGGDGGSRILGYNIEEYSRDHDDVKEKDEHKEAYSCGGNVTRKKVDALESSHAYRFRVQARNAVGVSDWSKFSLRVESVQNDKKRLEGGAARLSRFSMTGSLGDSSSSRRDRADE